MKEIEFRGFNSGAGWVYGSLVYSYKEDGYYITTHDEYEYSYPVVKDSIGQFTGLRDKEGVAIFEDDIIDFAGIKLKALYDGLYAIDNQRVTPSTYHIKVIGNIYENTDLL